MTENQLKYYEREILEQGRAATGLFTNVWVLYCVMKMASPDLQITTRH